MNIDEKFIYIGILVFAVTPRVWSTNTDLDAKTLIPLSQGSHVKLGKGSDIYDLPIAECKKDLTDNYELNCEVSTRKKDQSNNRCKLILAADESVKDIDVDGLYQFPGDKLFIIWHYLPTVSKGAFHSLINKTTVVNMGNCSDTVTQFFPRKKDDWSELFIIYFHDDGFDAVVVQKTLAPFTDYVFKFDTEARQLNNSPVNYFFYYNYPDTNTKKNVKYGLLFSEHLEIKHKEITKYEGQWFTYCVQMNELDSKSFECRQYDCLDRHWDYMEPVNLTKPVKLIDVYGLKGLGIVLFALESDSELVVVELIPKYEPKIQKYKLKWPTSNLDNIVVLFDDINGNFSLVWETNGAERSIVLQNFNLPRKFSQSVDTSHKTSIKS